MTNSPPPPNIWKIVTSTIVQESENLWGPADLLQQLDCSEEISFDIPPYAVVRQGHYNLTKFQNLELASPILTVTYEYMQGCVSLKEI